VAVTKQNLPDDGLGAFCRDNHAALAHTGSGALDGLTFAAKDVFHVAGARTGFGNPDWLRTHPIETTTAAAVQTLLGAGADMLGRTLTDEFTYSLSGENAHYGTPVNSAAPDRIPGGSSSGSASAVAGQLVDFALGTDCGGSVRLPASYCGILGMRPTHGRVPVDGVIPFAPSFDVVGWFARDATVFSRVGEALLGERSGGAGANRLLLARDAFELVGSEIGDALRPAIDALARIVGRPQELRVSTEGLDAWYEVFRVVQGAEIWGNRRAWIEAVEPTIGPGIRERLEWASAIEPAATARAVKRHAEIRRYLRGLLAPGDILCLPTSPRVAPRIGVAPDTLEIEYRAQAMCLLCIAGLGGLPQISLPLATQDDLPLGVSLIGAPGSDMSLLRLTAEVLGHGLGSGSCCGWM
jgi:amidase